MREASVSGVEALATTTHANSRHNKLLHLRTTEEDLPPLINSPRRGGKPPPGRLLKRSQSFHGRDVEREPLRAATRVTLGPLQEGPSPRPPRPASKQGPRGLHRQGSFTDRSGLVKGSAGLSAGVRTMLSPQPLTPIASKMGGAQRGPGMTTAQSGDFASRFVNQRSSASPKIVGLDSEKMIPRGKSSKSASRGIGGFFPPVKLRQATDPTVANSLNKLHDKAKTPPAILELAPERLNHSPDHWSSQTAPAPANTVTGTTGGRDSSQSTKSNTSPYKLRAHAMIPAYPHFFRAGKAEGLDSLSDLPHPHMVLSRDTPWVYRYKVKRSMNELSKIMASKPIQQPVEFATSQ